MSRARRGGPSALALSSVPPPPLPPGPAPTPAASRRLAATNRGGGVRRICSAWARLRQWPPPLSVRPLSALPAGELAGRRAAAGAARCSSIGQSGGAEGGRRRGRELTGGLGFCKGKEVLLCAAVCWRQKSKNGVCCAQFQRVECAVHKIIIWGCATDQFPYTLTPAGHHRHANNSSR